MNDEIKDELRFHIEERIRQLVAQGMSPEEAGAEARRRFGDAERYAREIRRIERTIQSSSRRVGWGDSLRRELRHAARVLWRTPAFSLMAFLTLALGLAATTAIYTVVERVLLRPLPYPGPEELVAVQHPTSSPGTGESQWGIASVGYFHFRNARSLQDLGAYRTGSLAVSNPGRDAVEIRTAQATASVFTVLGGRAALGRVFNTEDDRPGLPWRDVVISYEFWQRYYGGDRGVIGRTIHTAAAPFTIIGVTQPGLTLPKPGPFASKADLAGFGVDLWLPLNLDPATRQNNHALYGVGRLTPGYSAEDAQRELAGMLAQFTTVYPEVYSQGFMRTYNFRVSVTPLLDDVLGSTVGTALWILFGAVGLVLLIACANVANLFLVRMEARRREAAIRGALGASRGRMAAHYLAESLLVSLAAGVAGVLLAKGSIAAILAVAPRSLPRLAGVELTWTAVAVAAGLSVLAGLAFGLLPLLRDRVDIETLRESARGLTTSRRRRFLRNGLVVSQVALALMLLAGAGLMIRSFLALHAVRPGLDPSGVVTLRVNLPYRTYETMTRAANFHRDLAERVRAIPGVAAVGATALLPLRDYGIGCAIVFRERRPYARGEATPCVSTVTTLPGFFQAMGIPVRGRAPEWSDVAGKTQAVVVTHALAERLWPGEDPIGKGIGLNGPDSEYWYRVVGVVPELRAHGLDQAPSEALFLPGTALIPGQESWGMLNYQELVIRVSRGSPLEVAGPVRDILRNMDSSVPIAEAVTMQAVVERSMSRTTFIMLLLGLAAGMALVLSAVGIYAVISYLVAQRRQEIGMRIALGAPVERVLGLVLGQTARLALAGVALGMLGVIAGTRLLRSLLFGVGPNDPLVLAAVPVVLLLLALLASYLPARRAAGVDPVEVLRG